MIRPAILADAQTIRACSRAAFARYVGRMGREPAPMQTDPAAAIVAAEAYVATGPDGRILGHVICRPAGGDMVLDTLAVWPDDAGRGVGKRLVAHVEALARQQGLDAVTLYTNAAMTENLPFYESLGYTRIARQMQDGFDRVFFRKSLSAG